MLKAFMCCELALTLPDAVPRGPRYGTQRPEILCVHKHPIKGRHRAGVMGNEKAPTGEDGIGPGLFLVIPRGRDADPTPVALCKNPHLSDRLLTYSDIMLDMRLTQKGTAG